MRLISVPDWLQEFQENESALVVEDAEISQTVNLFGCKSSTIVVKDKVNAVTLGAMAPTSIR
jgi:adenylyl cyclase-associated protein